MFPALATFLCVTALAITSNLLYTVKRPSCYTFSIAAKHLPHGCDLGGVLPPPYSLAHLGHRAGALPPRQAASLRYRRLGCQLNCQASKLKSDT